jgi:hypothetical protein
MRVTLTAAAFGICCIAQAACSQAVPTEDAGFVNAAPNQWFTGSLEAPSPALPKAGMLALEPYFVFQSSTGSYGDNGAHAPETDHTQTLESLLVIKYGITSKLTIEALPSFSHSWNDKTASQILSLDDLPLELEYRVKEGNYRNGSPSVTFDLGVTVPSGAYDQLRNSLSGVGQGAYLLKQGVVLQSLFDTWGNHPVRIRVYGAIFEPLTHPSVGNVSVYGTGLGFAGNVRPGISGNFGIGGGWAINQRWVLVLDFVQSYAAPYRLNGIDGAGGQARTRGRSEASTAFAPAFEYNWSAKGGLIAGVEFTAAGRNTPSYIAPQIAVAFSF